MIRAAWSMTISVVAIAALAGCGTFTGAHPRGFAPWSDNDGSIYRAASPDGLVWRIRTESHDPVADLDFWKRALRDRLAGAQYLVTDSLQFAMGEHPAFALESGQDNLAWLVAIAPVGKKIVVVEVSGPLEAFQKHRSDILATLPNIRLR